MSPLGDDPMGKGGQKYMPVYDVVVVLALHYVMQQKTAVFLGKLKATWRLSRTSYPSLGKAGGSFISKAMRLADWSNKYIAGDRVVVREPGQFLTGPNFRERESTIRMFHRPIR
jgi:hypothetical protein